MPSEGDVRVRSLLFVPADDERKLARGAESGADALILDLEDSVAAARRPEARRLARAFLERPKPGRMRRYVRINPLESGLALDDLAAVMPGQPDGIMLPKALPEDLAGLDRRLAELETAASVKLGTTRVIVIATETPAAVFALGGYAAAPARLEGLTWGAEDLAAILGAVNRRPDGSYDDVFRLARALCLLAASNAGVAAIDTIYADYKDESGLKAECEAARRAGFTAKLAIHPAQLSIINPAFSATAEELGWAKQVVAAFEANPEAGTVGIAGKMIDRPHLLLARRILARAQGKH
jgi:citrate lyase subunit beta / citryl-CoA lyase